MSVTAPAPQLLRDTLAHVPTAVTVIAAEHEGHRVGLTTGTFTSVSLDPPYVAFCPGHASRSWPVIREAGAFCASVLADDQEELATWFAGVAEDKFAGVAARTAPSGSPIVDGAVAWIDCRLERTIEAGDHWIAIGRVLEIDQARDARALVFVRRGFGGVAVAPPATRQVTRVADTRLPTREGELRVVAYAQDDGTEHLVLLPSGATGIDPVRVHVRCGLGDTFAASGCGCRTRLESSLKELAGASAGSVVYLRCGRELLASCRDARPEEDDAIASAIAEDLRRTFV